MFGWCGVYVGLFGYDYEGLLFVYFWCEDDLFDDYLCQGCFFGFGCGGNSYDECCLYGDCDCECDCFSVVVQCDYLYECGYEMLLLSYEGGYCGDLQGCGYCGWDEECGVFWMIQDG